MLLVGCGPSTELRVPKELAQEPFLTDIEESLVGEDGTAKVDLVAGDRFQYCPGSGAECLEIAFTDTRLADVIWEAYRVLIDREGCLRVFVIGGWERGDRIEEVVTAIDGEYPETIDVILRTRGESTEDFVTRVLATVDVRTDGVVAIFGADSFELLPRMEPEGDAIGIIPELFLTAAGERIRDAGYPLIGAISPDMTTIFRNKGINDEEGGEIHVDLQLFRY